MVTRTRDIFTTVTTEGALLPPDILQHIAEGSGDLDGLTPESYHLYGERLNEATNYAWNRLQGAWQAFKNARDGLAEDDVGTTATRERWLLQLFGMLGYGRLETAAAMEIDGKSYAISHRWRNVPMHLLGCKVRLDKRTPGVTGAASGSPHSIIQVFLNRSDEHLWGFLSNGLRLRVLRDNVSLTRQAYIEFDLEAMMEGEVYADFVLLYLLCHQSRVEADNPTEYWLEQWMKTARVQGTRALDQLRDGVERAIEHLGAGFVEHADNWAMRDALKDGSLDRQDYYRELLRLVYRLLFLFVAEDRDLLHDPETPREARACYEHYSTRRLREIAAELKGTRHHDLYEGLRVVMKLLGGEMPGAADLSLPVLGSFLFRDEAMPHLIDCKLSNRALLDAMRAVSTIEDPEIRRLRTVDFKNLGAEELGSVYESLLELHPRINVEARTFALETAGGHERKTTGSYYTPTSLINALLDSALAPVLDEAASKPTLAEREQAILDLKVCDPACGSGHFLIAAANRMARRLAGVREGEEEPSPAAMREAKRDIIARCIYGVDLNEMAVELCKVNLWLESLVPGKPLSFLDHRIQHGNSLLGTTPALMARGIPDDAFKPIEGDDRKLATSLRRQNKQERKQREAGVTQSDFFSIVDPSLDYRILTSEMQSVVQIDDSTLKGVQKKEARYRALEESNRSVKVRTSSDAWLMAFIGNAWIAPFMREFDEIPLLTDARYWNLTRSPLAEDFKDIRKYVSYLSKLHSFFQWHIAFPDVFTIPSDPKDAENAQTGWNGGFDVVLGNPPWERIKIQEKEWFAGQHEEIASAPRASIRRRLITELEKDDPTLYYAFRKAKRKAEGESHFARMSGRYPLCGRGDINTYQLFAELCRQLAHRNGFVGIIVPSGIATDATTQYFFNDLVQSGELVSLFDFENRGHIFQALHTKTKFSLLTMSGQSRESAVFAFMCMYVSDLKDDAKVFELTPQDFVLLNPNTRNCPIFRTRTDTELTKRMYRNVPVLLDEATGRNPWAVSLATMLHMANDSNLFKTEPGSKSLRLYESKMFWHFDHRWASSESRSGNLYEPSEKIGPSFLASSRYWINQSDIEKRLAKRWSCNWLIALRNITDSRNERSVVLTVLPRVGLGHSASVVFFESDLETEKITCFVANFDSFPFDYVARQKIGGTNLTQSVVMQLPVLPPSTYTPDLLTFIVPRVLELSYTAWDLQAFAQDVGYDGPPFIWDEDRRFWLRAELDALYFHLYGIARDDVDYIMETFPIVKRKDEKAHGNYRTKEAILTVYDEMAALGVAENAGRVKDYETRLSPGPASEEVAHEQA